MTGARFLNISQEELNALRAAAANPVAPAANPMVPPAEIAPVVATDIAAQPAQALEQDVVGRAFLQGKLHLLLDPVDPTLRQDEAARAVEARFKKALPLRQRATPPNGPVDVLQWLERLGQYASMTCGIELNGGTHLGSGFLVGPDLVMTSSHFLDGLIHNGAADAIRIVFDQQLGVDGVRAERSEPIRLKKSQPVLMSQAHKLDFMLLRTETEPGYALSPTGRTRSWVELPVAPFPVVPNMYVSGIHRPRADELLFSPGFVCGDHDGRIVKYTLSMQPGSSGSPAFTANWQLLAVHNMDVPADKLGPDCTAGILAWRIGEVVREQYTGELPERAPVPLEID